MRDRINSAVKYISREKNSEKVKEILKNTELWEFLPEKVRKEFEKTPARGRYGVLAYLQNLYNNEDYLKEVLELKKNPASEYGIDVL